MSSPSTEFPDQIPHAAAHLPAQDRLVILRGKHDMVSNVTTTPTWGALRRQTSPDMPPRRRRKILLVYPKFPMSFWSFGYIQHIGGFKAVMPPLGLAILGA